MALSQAPVKSNSTKELTMNVLVSGSSGLVGSALRQKLQSGSDKVVRLVRGDSGSDSILWSPSEQTIDAEKLEGFDAVVHLAGENIASGRWTAARKQRILDSRVQGTQLLASTLAKLEQPPRVLVSASATGFYGNRGDESLDEHSEPGDGFLADVCRAWEKATEPASEAGIRVVHLRFGIILSPEGGALKNMLLPFRLGAGGRVGSGTQYWSWISLPDVVGVIQHAIENQDLSGPVNAVSPQPVTNAEFTRVLGKVLRRPTIFPMPAAAAKMALGQMAQDLLLSSTRVYPKVLEESGYTFQDPDLSGALTQLLKS
jgi:uncharacterized protein (TIGR01777 family)